MEQWLSACLTYLLFLRYYWETSKAFEVDSLDGAEYFCKTLF